MPDTSTSTIDASAPSAQIEALLTAVAARPRAAEGMRAMMQRASEFPNPLAAKLTGIALDPYGREFADRFLDAYWSDEPRQQAALRATGSGSGTDREVIIGSGFHAAVYAAVRVLSGHPRPLVLERGDRVGGTFAMTARPTFYLNSRNRGGNGGLAGDQGASLNYLPGAPIQAANVSMTEFQTNTDMAWVIRLALTQFADVVTNAEVVSVVRDGAAVEIQLDGRSALFAGRVIDARGLGDPSDLDIANGSTILTFGQFMARMATMWPLRGIRRAAVVGGGDAAKCAVESLLGIGPQPPMAAAALDSVDRIDWYTDTLPTTCERWQQEIRGRYQAIGRYLRPDRLGLRRLTVLGRRARPVALPGLGLIDGRTYDLVVVCTGNREVAVDGLAFSDFYDYPIPDTDAVVASQHYNLPVFRVGPHALLPFTPQEFEDGIAEIPANAVSMFRTATKTAALAATLPAVTED
ncbi:FAD-dependent oxidoreductase [Virgisporangium aurantiacum]|uniref:Uncharacterized protein n=1 Tax=Virgisporangium aurantiacum TaxID=175570 RepID=A0A8J3ZIA2_9ACTN|nr:FAD-dependent oxidoreductase [Virgisporangium aurantiacum]GIJ62046.1 hypothetical protein Vau01_095620 [Virgisporangium aurantiacum]